MTKLTIRHKTIPVTMKNRPAYKRWPLKVFGMFYFGTPSYCMTHFENFMCSLVGLIMLALVVLGLKKYVVPLLLFLRQIL
jgi:hypothetical protein